jgi:acetyl-CoA C-acetyltransferase
MEEVVVLSAVRTPIGRFGGTLASLPAPALGEAAAKAALAHAGIEAADVDAVIFGMARQAGARPNPARQVLWRAGVPKERVALTVNQACASGMQALQLAADELRLGRAQVVLAGGMESMSNVPHALDRMRDGYRLGDGAIVDLMYRDGFHCPLADRLMGETAEVLAQEFGISRSEQDVFAHESQQKAAAAWDAGAFHAEIAPVAVETRKGSVTFARDEHPRPDTTLASLHQLMPVFDRKSGTVTAGNSSGITDGAAALVLTTARNAAARGWTPLARLLDAQVVGCDPLRMGLGPVPATVRLLQRHGWSLDDFDLFELNEAFAAQVLACLRELPIPRARLNVHGGAIALGHPIGATGARVVVTLLHALRLRGARRGRATLCVSGGLGMTSAWELV